MTLEKNQEAYARKTKNVVVRLLDKQLQEVIGNIEGIDTKSITKAAVGVDIFDQNAAAKEMNDAVAAVMFELAKSQGAIAIAFAGAEELDFELIEALISRIIGHVDKVGGAFAGQTADALGDIILESQINGWSPQQTKAAITDLYSGYKGYRAERLGRTESLFAANQATLEGYRQVGYVTGKEWFANPGACEFCRELDGKITELDKDYVPLGGSIFGDDGGTYAVDYDAIGGPPAHPNCTCTVLPFIGDR